jgi:hypothetical protein
MSLQAAPPPVTFGVLGDLPLLRFLGAEAADSGWRLLRLANPTRKILDEDSKRSIFGGVEAPFGSAYLEERQRFACFANALRASRGTLRGRRPCASRRKPYRSLPKLDNSGINGTLHLMACFNPGNLYLVAYAYILQGSRRARAKPASVGLL